MVGGGWYKESLSGIKYPDGGAMPRATRYDTDLGAAISYCKELVWS